MHLIQTDSNIINFSSLFLILYTIARSIDCLSIDQNYANKLQTSQETTGRESDLPPPVKNPVSDTRQQLQTREHIQVYDNRRPIWVLSHMVNSIKELDYRLGKGANAVEVDVTFGSNGDPLYTYHGPPCDCWRHCNQQEDFNEYLSYVREIAIEEKDGIGTNLTILFLDLKLDYLDFKAKARAGKELARSILNNLYVDKVQDNNIEQSVGGKGSKFVPKRMLRLILSVNHVGDIELIRNFIHHMEEQNSAHLMSLIGFDVGMNDDIQMIESMWRRLNRKVNIWQGDGYTNCISPFYNLRRLTKALQKRDSITGYPNKIYHWTIDIHDRMRESLRLGVDGLMTNHPERAVKVLLEPDMVQNFRLATIDDDPFRKIIRSGRGVESARFQRSAHPTSDGFFGNLWDVIASWYNYVKEIPIFSFPTTRRLFKSRRPVKKSNTDQASTPTYTAKQLANFTDTGNNTLSRSDQNSFSTDNSNNSTTDVMAKNSGLVSVSDAIEGILVGDHSSDKDSHQLEASNSEGPKWYISLASNILVSFMKIIMPADT